MGSKATVMVGINPMVLGSAKWIGTGAGVSGAILIALNLGIVMYGFALFLLSSLLWGSVALVQREPSLAVLQGAFTAINLLGLWRWAGS
jgi:hypothetical protein